jgi:hypothetical protein
VPCLQNGAFTMHQSLVQGLQMRGVPRSKPEVQHERAAHPLAASRAAAQGSYRCEHCAYYFGECSIHTLRLCTHGKPRRTYRLGVGLGGPPGSLPRKTIRREVMKTTIHVRKLPSLGRRMVALCRSWLQSAVAEAMLMPLSYTSSASFISSGLQASSLLTSITKCKIVSCRTAFLCIQ